MNIYIVKVDMRDLKIVCQYGPFLSYDRASECVVNLSARSDVLQAYIVDASTHTKSPVDWKEIFKKAGSND